MIQEVRVEAVVEVVVKIEKRKSQAGKNNSKKKEERRKGIEVEKRAKREVEAEIGIEIEKRIEKRIEIEENIQMKVNETKNRMKTQMNIG